MFDLVDWAEANDVAAPLVAAHRCATITSPTLMLCAETGTLHLAVAKIYDAQQGRFPYLKLVSFYGIILP